MALCEEVMAHLKDGALPQEVDHREGALSVRTWLNFLPEFSLIFEPLKHI